MEHRFEIAAQGPFRLDLTAWLLRRRARNTIDLWDEETGTHRRTMLIGGEPTLVSTTQPYGAPSRLAVKLEGPAAEPGNEDEARRAVERLLGLGVAMSGFTEMAASDPDLGPIAAPLAGVRPPRYPTVFEGLLNAVACQKISLDAGISILGRTTARYGRPVEGVEAAPRLLPGPEELAGTEPEELKELGFSQAKGRTTVETSRAIVAGELDLEELDGMSDEDAVAALVSIWGVGRWTAEYTLLRGLGRVNVIPGDDVGAFNSLSELFGREIRDWDAVAEATERWRPYAGLVYFHMLLNNLRRSGAIPDQAGQ